MRHLSSPRVVLLIAIILSLTLFASACSWWKGGGNVIRVINDTGCKLYITMDERRETSIEPGETLRIDDLDDGRYILAAYVYNFFSGLCAYWESDNLNGDDTDTWRIDEPECDACNEAP